MRAHLGGGAVRVVEGDAPRHERVDHDPAHEGTPPADVFDLQAALLAHWNGDAKVEARIKEETGLTTRCRPFALKQEPGKCVVTGEPSLV